MIDYKRDMIGNKEDDKKEFLRDVSSFANDSGGHLILGIDEEQGIPKRFSGLIIKDIDSEINRLEQIIIYGIEPKIPGLSIAPVKLNTSPTSVVIILRIPKSFALPHRIKSHDVFYARSSTGKYALDISQIRNLLLLSESAIERIRNFRDERIRIITSGETPIPTIGYPKIVLHIVPLSMSNPAIKYDISSNNEYLNDLMSFRISPINRCYNFDGYLTYSKLEESLDAPSYVQLFRNGSFEALWTYPLVLYRKEKKIPSELVEEVLLNKVRFYLNFQKYYLKVEPPIFIMLSLIGVHGLPSVSF